MRHFRVKAVLALARLFRIPVQVHQRYFMAQLLK